MIPQNPSQSDNMPSWKRSLQQVVREVDELLKLLELDRSDLKVDIDPYFPLRVPQEFVQKMQKGNPSDPLLLQVLPILEENKSHLGFSTDYLAEKSQNPVPGILHKYADRVLLTPTKACAVHCRYCFRRHFPYEENAPSLETWQNSLKYVAERPNIREVILSGGDPLSLTDHALKKLITYIADIEHVKLLRFHTRFPVMIPSRITSTFLNSLQNRLSTTLVLHINHPNEIDASLAERVSQLKSANVTVLNQSVLLKGVNDHADTLIQLSYQLFEAGILPYYVHLLDRITGTHHFEICESKAFELMQAQQAALPGYLMPRWVREVPKKSSKIPFNPS